MNRRTPLRIKLPVSAPPPEPPPAPPPDPTLHIGIVVPDIRVYDAIKRHSYMLTTDRPVKLHVMLADRAYTPETQFYRFLLMHLGMIDPAVHGLTYPEEIELGWADATD